MSASEVTPYTTITVKIVGELMNPAMDFWSQISRNLGSILVSESHYTFLSLSLYRCKMGIIAACPSQGCSEALKRHRKGSEQRQTQSRIWLLLLR